MRRRFLKSILIAGAWAVFTKRALARQKFKPVSQEISALIKMNHSAFPYEGKNPETGDVFLNVIDGKRRGHRASGRTCFFIRFRMILAFANQRHKRKALSKHGVPLASWQRVGNEAAMP